MRYIILFIVLLFAVASNAQVHFPTADEKRPLEDYSAALSAAVYAASHLFDCPKDSTHSFFSPFERMAYTYQVRHIKDIHGKCWDVERYIMHLPSGREVDITKEQYEDAELKAGHAETKTVHEHVWNILVYVTLPPTYEQECLICHERRAWRPRNILYRQER